MKINKKKIEVVKGQVNFLTALQMQDFPTVSLKINAKYLDAADAEITVEAGPDKKKLKPVKELKVSLSADGNYMVKITGNKNKFFRAKLDPGSNTQGEVELEICGQKAK